MRIAVRMDDITPDMDWPRFERFKRLLDEYGVKPLIGVVPDNQDGNLNRMQPRDRSMAAGHEQNGCREALQPGDREVQDSQIQDSHIQDSHIQDRVGENAGIRENRCDGEGEAFFGKIKRLQEQGWIVALHGYRHVYTQKKGGMFPLNHFSEFAGLSLERQKEMLADAVKILSAQGITTDIFMAPAHAYDRNTLRALQALGFRAVTDGFGRRPYRYAGLVFYPISFRLGLSLKRKKGTTTMVVHTNTMTEQDYMRCRRILETENVISYGEFLQEPAVPRGVAGRMGEYLLATGKHYLVKLL